MLNNFRAVLAEVQVEIQKTYGIELGNVEIVFLPFLCKSGANFGCLKPVFPAVILDIILPVEIKFDVNKIAPGKECRKNLTSPKIFSTFMPMMMYNTQNKLKGAYGAGAV